MTKNVPILLRPRVHKYGTETEKRTIRQLSLSRIAEINGNIYWLLGEYPKTGLMAEEVYHEYLIMFSKVRRSSITRQLTELYAAGLIRPQFVRRKTPSGRQYLTEVEREHEDKGYDVYWQGWESLCGKLIPSIKRCYLPRGHLGACKFKVHTARHKPILIAYEFKTGLPGLRVVYPDAPWNDEPPEEPLSPSQNAPKAPPSEKPSEIKRRLLLEADHA